MKYVSKVSTTTWVIIVTALVWLIYDLWTYFTDRETISEVITTMSYYSPAIPLIFGLLIGHWFWPASVERDD